MDKNDNFKEVADELQKFQLQLALPNYTYQQLLDEIAAQINILINENFSMLVALLYRLDISEKKLKVLLSKSRHDTSGDIIAEMIIERQLQKIKSRKAFKNNSTNISEDEKW